jgi:lactoylglutathione lyase
MEIKLIVIRTLDIEALANFYSNFGLSFGYHKHGNSPFHYSAIIGQTVLEIYPLAKTQDASDKYLRLGFAVDDFETVMNKLKSNGTLFFAEPSQTDFGYMAVVEDPDGRKIEVYRK